MKTKLHTYCYHITNGITRSAIICGTVGAESMEAAAIEAARRAKLQKVIDERYEHSTRQRWMKDGKPVSLYILHDPA